MPKNSYKQLVLDIRKKYPIFSIENIKNNFKSTLKEVGIEIKYAAMQQDELKNAESYVHFENNQPEIVINYKLDEFRQRFAITRELAHLLLHTTWIPYRSSYNETYINITHKTYVGTYNDYENTNQTEYFAIEFLAPLDEIKKSIIKYEKSDIKNFEEQIELLMIEYKLPRYLIYLLLQQIK